MNIPREFGKSQHIKIRTDSHHEILVKYLQETIEYAHFELAD